MLTHWLQLSHYALTSAIICVCLFFILLFLLFFILYCYEFFFHFIVYSMYEFILNKINKLGGADLRFNSPQPSTPAEAASPLKRG